MELHLCGSRYYNGHEDVYWKSVRDFIISKKISQVLFFGIASQTYKGPQVFRFFKEKLNLSQDVHIFNAEDKLEFAIISNPTVYVLGGTRQLELIEFIHNSPPLENIIRTCPYYFGESMGAKLVGNKLRIGKEGGPLVEGLGILKSTVIEGHYTQKQRQQVLKNEVKSENLKYGLGIDEDAEVITTPETFPKFQKVGPGVAEIVTS